MSVYTEKGSVHVYVTCIHVHNTCVYFSVHVHIINTDAELGSGNALSTHHIHTRTYVAYMRAHIVLYVRNVLYVRSVLHVRNVFSITAQAIFQFKSLAFSTVIGAIFTLVLTTLFSLKGMVDSVIIAIILGEILVTCYIFKFTLKPLKIRFST